MTTILVDQKPFVAALKAIDHAMARVVDRPVLATILIRPHPAGGIELVAADNYRIASRRLECPVVGEPGWKHLIRNDELPLLYAYLRATKYLQQVQLNAGDGVIRVTAPGARSSILIEDFEGRYPDTSTVLDVQSTYLATLNPAFLKDAARSFGKELVRVSIIRFVETSRPMALRLESEDGGAREVMMAVRSTIDMRNERVVPAVHQPEARTYEA